MVLITLRQAGPVVIIAPPTQNKNRFVEILQVPAIPFLVCIKIPLPVNSIEAPLLNTTCAEDQAEIYTTCDKTRSKNGPEESMPKLSTKGTAGPLNL